MTRFGCDTYWILRNQLVHAYFDINLDILWQTVQQDLPKLITLIEDPNP